VRSDISLSVALFWPSSDSLGIRGTQMDGNQIQYENLDLDALKKKITDTFFKGKNKTFTAPPSLSSALL